MIPVASSGQASEIVKQILDKLTEAAPAATAMPHVVTAYAARQVGWFVSGLFLAAVSSWLLRLLWDKPWYNHQGDFPSFHGICAILVIMAFLAGTIVTLANLGVTIAVIIDPTGMFILDLINK